MACFQFSLHAQDASMRSLHEIPSVHVAAAPPAVQNVTTYI